MNTNIIWLWISVLQADGICFRTWRTAKLFWKRYIVFQNGMIEKMVTKYGMWTSFQEILTGMKKCAMVGKIPYSMGIDTWAVDFVLLDENDERIGDAVAYRDRRTEDMDRKVYEFIPEDDLYGRTGIQKQIFNTIYQLMAVKSSTAGAA